MHAPTRRLLPRRPGVGNSDLELDIGSAERQAVAHHFIDQLLGEQHRVGQVRWTNASRVKWMTLV
jgi:hypothetical protein